MLVKEKEWEPPAPGSEQIRNFGGYYRVMARMAAAKNNASW